MPSPISAAGAYAAIARLANPAQGATPLSGESTGGASFASVLKDALVSVQQTGQKSDIQTQAMVNGKANIVDVVTAVAETEVAIDAVVAVRDRVIQAYEEIMRMPI